MRSGLSLAWVLLAVNCWPQNTYTISGKVVSELGGKPIKRVMVVIQPTGQQAIRRANQQGAGSAVVTGDDGRFVFSNLPPGKFSLAAQKQGGFVELFHQDGSYSTAIVTGPGLNSENLSFPLTLPGSITGTVVDEENEPVRDAQIILFRRGVFAGKIGTELRQYTQTNSSGTFHIARAMPGSFLIAVSARPWYAQTGQFAFGRPSETTVAPEFDVAYPITYYGGATDPNSAAIVSVAEGASTKVEIALQPVAAAHLRVPNNGEGFELMAVGPGGQSIFVNPGMMMAATETGMEMHVAPGRYFVGKGARGRKIMDIGGNIDLEALNIPDTTISGQLTVEGGEHAELGGLAFASSDGQQLAIQMEADGTFQVKGARSGRYEVTLPGAPGYYIKTVSVGGRQFDNNEIEVDDGSTMKISVIAANGTSNVDGTAVDADGAPMAGAMILLIPQNVKRISLIRRDQSDSDGTFTLPEAAPGRYTLVAIDNGRDLAYAEPGVIGPYLPNGQIIDVPVANGAGLKVKIQHRQR